MTLGRVEAWCAAEALAQLPAAQGETLPPAPQGLPMEIGEILQALKEAG